MMLWQEQGLVLLEAMSIKNKKVVDIGCGDGWASIRLKEKGAVVTAMDAMDRSDGKLRELLKLNIPYVASLEDLKDYDFIWCHHVLEHISDPIDFLCKLRRIGKQLWLVVPKATLERFAKGHINNYTMPVLIEHLRRSGWDVRNGSYNTYPGPKLGSLWVVINPYSGFDREKETTYSKYPLPMEVLNDPQENHLRTEVDFWNWDRIIKEEDK